MSEILEVKIPVAPVPAGLADSFRLWAQANADALDAPALAPCPFCRAKPSDRINPEGGNVPAVALAAYPGVFCVQCASCGASGPIEADADEAVKKWNAGGLAAEKVDAIAAGIKVYQEAVGELDPEKFWQKMEGCLVRGWSGHSREDLARFFRVEAKASRPA